MPASPDRPANTATGLGGRLDRNIEALLKRQQKDERDASFQDRVASRITRLAGSMIFVYIHAVFFGLWILINTGVLPILAPFDPSLVVLAMIASVEAIFISTFVMISQNRMAETDNKRADLDLQVSLLAEHEVTHILTLLAAIADKLGVDVHERQEIEELKKDVTPDALLDAMEKKAGAEG